MTLDDLRTELIVDGIDGEKLDMLRPSIQEQAKRFTFDEINEREEGDEAYSGRVQGNVTKDYAIEALNRVFGEERFKLAERVRRNLQDFAVTVATAVVSAEVNDLMRRF